MAKQKSDKTLLNRLDFAGIPEITIEEARSCGVCLAGVSLQTDNDPVGLETALRALGIFDFLKESSVDPLASND
jgi:hypothetical protein